MANTENIEAKLCAYVDGELDDAGRAEIEAHLAGNPQHRHLMAELTAQRDLLRGLPRAKAPDDLLDSVHSQLERSVLLDGAGAPRGEEAHVAGRINPWPRVFGIAAVLVLGVGLAAMIFLILPRQKSADFVINTTSPATALPPGSTSAPAATAAPGPGAAPTTDGAAPGAAGTVDRIARGGRSGPSASADGKAAGGFESAAAGPHVTETPGRAPAPPGAPVASKRGGDNVFEAKGGGLAATVNNDSTVVAGTLNQMFNNATVLDPTAVEEHLKQAPAAVPDNSMLVVVAADDPALANRRVQEFLTSNSIRWDEVPEPMPQPLAFGERQRMLSSRAQNSVQMRLKEGPPTADQQFQLQQRADEAVQAPAAAASDALALRRSAGEKSAAGPEDASSRPPLSKGGYERASDFQDAGQRGSGGGAAATAEPIVPPPPVAGVAPGASAPNAAASKSDASATDAFTKSGAAAANAATVDAATADKKAEKAAQSAEQAQPPPPAEQREQRPAKAPADSQQKQLDARDSGAVAQQQSQQPAPQGQVQQQAALPRSAPATDHPPTGVATGGVLPSDVAAAATMPSLEGGASVLGVGAQSVAGSSQQMIIARGLTPGQVNELFACVSNQNAGRVANYHRNGGNYTPATLPAVVFLGSRDNLNLSRVPPPLGKSAAAATPAPPATPASPAPSPAPSSAAQPAPDATGTVVERDEDLAKRKVGDSNIGAGATSAPAAVADEAAKHQAVAPATQPARARDFAAADEPEPNAAPTPTAAPSTAPAASESLADTTTEASRAPAGPPPSGPVTYDPESPVAQAPTAPATAATAATPTTARAFDGERSTQVETEVATAATQPATTQPFAGGIAPGAAEPRLDVVIVLQSDGTAAFQQQQSPAPNASGQAGQQAAPNAAPDAAPNAAQNLAPQPAPAAPPAPTTAPAPQ